MFLCYLFLIFFTSSFFSFRIVSFSLIVSYFSFYFYFSFVSFLSSYISVPFSLLYS
jgi:hypothetical protein